MAVEIGTEDMAISGAAGHRLVLRVADIPGRWKWHVDDDPLTAVIDRAAARFVRAGFPARRAFLLVRSVYAWGGLRGRNPERVTLSCQELGDDGLAHILAAAHGLSLRGDFKGAIEALSCIKGMQVSFHSKILRFLCPDHAAVLDSRIVKACGHPPTPSGYASFVTDCRRIRDQLNATGVLRADGKPWRTTDVEMAIFAQIKHNLALQQHQAA